MHLYHEFALCLCFVIVKTHSCAHTTVTMCFELGTISILAKAEWKAVTCLSATESQNVS